VVYSDTKDITNSKLYVDGVLQTVHATNMSSTAAAYTESLTIGGDKASGDLCNDRSWQPINAPTWCALTRLHRFGAFRKHRNPL
jgi:hypothetical protein